MKYRFMALCALLWAASAAAQDKVPYPVEPFPFPHRAVAAASDFNAVRYNPAGLGGSDDVEFAWHHKVSGNPTGFNAATIRAKNMGFSISWLNDAVYGKRREYLLSGGHRVSRMISFGSTFRWLKADDPTLQNSTTWTFATMVSPAPAFTAAARWENALHDKVGGISTYGQWVFGVSSRPIAKTEFSLDWIYPGWADFGNTDLRFAAKFEPTPGVAVRGFIDTREFVGLEVEFAVERSKAGAEARFRDYSEYQDGTLYLTVLNHDYEKGVKRPTQ